MNVSEALNTLISAVNVAHGKGSYSLEESHFIYMAISYLNSLSKEEEKTITPSEKAPIEQVQIEEVKTEQGNVVESLQNNKTEY